MKALDIINTLAKSNNGHFTTSDALDAGLSKTILSRLAENGQIIRIAHGQYILPNPIPDELYILQTRCDNQTFAAALKNYTAQKNPNWALLREYADVFRILELLRQYLEVLT